MKKILTTIAAITISFNLDAIPIEKYKNYADQFSPETDLINGLILLNSNLLQPHRFFGPIKFYKKAECVILLKSSDFCVKGAKNAKH